LYQEPNPALLRIVILLVNCRLSQRPSIAGSTAVLFEVTKGIAQFFESSVTLRGILALDCPTGRYRRLVIKAIPYTHVLVRLLPERLETVKK
jgi:hypothetical protein